MSNDIILNVIVPNGIILSAIMPCHDTEFYFAKWHRVLMLNAKVPGAYPASKLKGQRGL